MEGGWGGEGGDGEDGGDGGDEEVNSKLYLTYSLFPILCPIRTKGFF